MLPYNACGIDGLHLPVEGPGKQFVEGVIGIARNA